jgi:hypothetical protein
MEDHLGTPADDEGGEPYDQGPGEPVHYLQPGAKVKRSWTADERAEYLAGIGEARRFDRSLGGPPLIEQIGDAERLVEQTEQDWNEASEEFRVASRVIEAEHYAERALSDEDQAEYEHFLGARSRWEKARVAYETARLRLSTLLGQYDQAAAPDQVPFPAGELSVAEYEKFAESRRGDHGREAVRGFTLEGG